MKCISFSECHKTKTSLITTTTQDKGQHQKELTFIKRRNRRVTRPLLILVLYVIGWKDRDIFNRMAKVIRVCFGFTLLRSVIGLKNSRHSLNQTDAKLKVSQRSHTRLPASFYYEFSFANSKWSQPLFWLVFVISLVFHFEHSVESCSNACFLNQSFGIKAPLSARNWNCSIQYNSKW